MKKLLTSPRFIFSGLGFFVVALFLYSFTQIDLSLTLSRASLFQTIQKGFQYVGYFNRPLSAELYFFIVIGLFTFYMLLLEGLRKKTISAKQFWVSIILTTILLMSTYNAFSYDVFNYIFDAKIVTNYHEDPYLKKALDFPGDPMLSFMRWTHRTYPYGPVWLGISVPLSFAGMQVFTITFALFKVLMAGAFLGTVYFLHKILTKLTPSMALFGTAAFALNPLVLIESLVSAHNDIVMMFFAVGSIYFLTKKRFIWAFLLLFISIGIKFATVFLLPVFCYALYVHIRQKTIHWQRLFSFMLMLMFGAVLAATLRSNFQPWYLLYVLPFVALLPERKYVFSPLVLLSIIGLYNYIPYLFTGNWDPPIPAILNNLNMTAAVVSGMLFLILLKIERRKSKGE